MFPINSKVLKVMEGKGKPMQKLGKLAEMLNFNIVERNSLVAGQVIIVGITLNCLSICQLADHTSWHRGVAVIPMTQIPPTKPELSLDAGSNPTHGVSEICDGGNL